MSNSHASSNSDSFPCWCAPVPDCVAVVNDNSTPASLSEGVLSVGGLEINYFDILDVTLKCNADAVAQVDHFAPSAFTVGTCCGESATYEIKLISNQCEGDPLRSDYSITVATDMTVAEIVDAFVAVINADESAFVTATDGTSYVALTADTAGCAFTVTFVSDNIIHTAFTANVAPFGEASQVEADGGTPLTSSTDYHAIDILYRAFLDNTDQCTNCLTVCKQLCRVYVIDSSAGDSFITSVADITDGTASAASYLARSVAAASFVCA